MTTMIFESFPKIPRLKRSITISEKIDGTNAQIVISRALVGSSADTYSNLIARVVDNETGVATSIRAGSRSRWIVPGDDNYGFAKWVCEHQTELLGLGEGQHFGEWWGSGVQRGYGLTDGEKRFSLFNTARWGAHNPPPGCCSVVPVLAHTDLGGVAEVLEKLRAEGSVAAPGFEHPEGVVVYHSAAKQYFKVLLDNDDQPKGVS